MIKSKILNHKKYKNLWNIIDNCKTDIYNGIVDINNNAYEQQLANQLENYLLVNSVQYSKEDIDKIVRYGTKDPKIDLRPYLNPFDTMVKLLVALHKYGKTK